MYLYNCRLVLLVNAHKIYTEIEFEYIGIQRIVCVQFTCSIVNGKLSNCQLKLLYFGVNSISINI